MAKHLRLVHHPFLVAACFVFLLAEPNVARASPTLQHPFRSLPPHQWLRLSEELKGGPYGFIDLPARPVDQEGQQKQEQAYTVQQLTKEAGFQRKPEEWKMIKKEGAVMLGSDQFVEWFGNKHGLAFDDGQRKSSGIGRGKCTYTASVKTSCSSPRVTHDAISLAFGDVYHNEVYVARLDDPASGTFERCSVDTFRIVGPCGGKTCYLYLRRYGRDGWTPESVKIFYRPDDSRAAVTFFFDVPVPNGVWYGFDLCHGGGPMRGLSTVTGYSAAAVSSGVINADRERGREDNSGGGGDRSDAETEAKPEISGSAMTATVAIE